jgi:hypothetical protein
VRLLIDTHAMLWSLSDDARLGKQARTLIEDPENDNLVSVVSLWEIAVKLSRYPAGGLAIFCGRRCMGRYNPDGSPPGEAAAVPSYPGARLACRAGAVTGRRREMVRTVSPGNVRRRHRSSRGQNSNDRTHDVLPKPDKLISYRYSTP